MTAPTRRRLPCAKHPPAPSSQPPAAIPAASPASSPSPSAAVAPAAVIYTCESQPFTEPSGYTLACADGNGGLSGMSWPSWTADGATGTGEYYQNDCTPDCADGTFVDYPATVTLSNPIASPDGGEYFTQMTVVSTGLPGGSNTWTLGPDGPA
jgi:hypothetical protein